VGSLSSGCVIKKILPLQHTCIRLDNEPARLGSARQRASSAQLVILTSHKASSARLVKSSNWLVRLTSQL
jgi:hypothetical protein